MPSRMIEWAALLGRIRWRRPRIAPVSDRSAPDSATRLVPREESMPHVPREYQALYTYLEHRYASAVVLTFGEIEALLGFTLPTSARTQREWWTDTTDTQRHREAWIRTGRTAAPNLPARNITFKRLV